MIPAQTTQKSLRMGSLSFLFCYSPKRRKDVILLRVENPAFADIKVSAESAFEVWGVMTKSIRTPALLISPSPRGRVRQGKQMPPG
jgi:hypothetical protein